LRDVTSEPRHGTDYPRSRKTRDMGHPFGAYGTTDVVPSRGLSE